VLVIFEDSDDSATRANHRMILLQTATLREVAVIRHGLCNNVAHEEFPQSAETLTLVCYDSQDPREKTKNRSIALVTLDVKDGRVLRWFALGGKRHSMWFGPMFFGHYHDAGMVRIRISPCPQVYPAVPRSAYADAVSVSAYPDWVFVMRRRGPGKDFVSGDVWRVSSNLAEMPPDVLPASECLRDVVARVLPYWYDVIAPQLLANQDVLVTAHGNSLRALLKHLEHVSDAEIADVNIPTGAPRQYRFDERLTVTSAGYLGDADAVAAAAEAVARQAGTA
jgi:hypothetical protein